MKDIKILVSATGAPGCSTLIRYLKGIDERNIEIIGVDMDNEAVGRFFCDKFYQVPAVTDPNYLYRMINIIVSEKIDVFFCVSSMEVELVAKNIHEFIGAGCVTTVSSYDAISRAVDKHEVYKTVSRMGLPVPVFRAPKNLAEFISDAYDLGYPHKEICFKPFISKGSRGFRIINDTISKKNLLMNYKPEAVYISMDEFKSIFKNEEFPNFLLMEKVSGTNYDCMVLANDGESLLTTIKTRENSRWGIITNGELVDSPIHIELCEKIIKEFGLSYNISIQFIDEYIIEINPRTSTYIYGPDFIEPYLAIKLALDEVNSSDIRKYQKKVPIGRRMVRYMDQVFFDDKTEAYFGYTKGIYK